ncbi:MAG: FAD-binding protein [Deltaproteobacteria bacterium]|nr:FAD-binding protein [Deltaproteobacteria bacterium]
MIHWLPQHLRRRRARATGLSRRQFLSHSARLGVAAGLAAPIAGLVGCGGGSSASAKAWDALAASLSGTLLRPGSRGYNAARLPTNLRYASVHPDGIAQCLNAEDVRTSILWARQHGVPLAARGGGHSYGGFSTTGGLQIDVSPLRSLSVDPDNGVLQAGSGARNMDVAATLPAYDLVLPGGVCTTVCLSGLTLGGGLGYNARQLGTTSDRLLSTEIVTADGEILTCDAQHDADLFWAVRGGGGGNFGIHTSFTYQLSAAPPRVAVAYLEWHGAAAAAAVLEAYQPLLVHAPHAYSGLFSSFVLGDDDDPDESLVAYLLTQYRGPLDELRDLLAPLQAVAPPAVEDFQTLSFWEAQAYLSESGGMPDATADHSNFAVDPLPSAAIETIVDTLAHLPKGPTGTYGVCALFSWVGGAVNRVPADATAFVHRDAAYLIEMGAAWPGGADAAVERTYVDWVDALWSSVQPYVTAAAYQNFIDPALTDWQQAYYGANFERLVQVKAAYDPDDLFHFAQSIPTHL